MLHDLTSTSPRRWIARLVLAITATLAFVTLGVPSTAGAVAPDPAPASVKTQAPAKAPAAPRARNYYGAISVATDGASGVSYNYGSKAAAFRRSQSGCKRYSSFPRTCTRIVWVRNQCAAVSARFNGAGYVTNTKWGAGPSRAVAQRRARANFGGRIVGWTCTAR